MSKTKKKSILARSVTSPPRTLDAYIDVETITHIKAECCICGEEDEDTDTTTSSFSDRLYKVGWREVTSKKFYLRGIMCPECAKTPDVKRGE